MKAETSFTINMAPIRVWSHLADFSTYTFWHPNYRFEADAMTIEQRIPLSYALYKGEYRIKAEATITASEKPDLFSWTVGVGGIAVLEETYRLESLASGTQVRHSIAFDGFFSRIIAVPFRRGLTQTLVIQDGAFVRFLKKEMQRAGGANLNRHRRRARAARYPEKGANDG
jgi:hypothetical protein